MNEEIRDLINRILDDPSDNIPIDLLRDLTDRLIESEVYVPVDGEDIIHLGLGPGTYIPISCDLDDFKIIFKDETPGLFSFEKLRDFLTPDVSGFAINYGGGQFILNRYLCELAFNRNRPQIEVSRGYDVKVRLNDFRPLTWRDLIIPENITFMELDDILKTLWGFNGHHLSCFLLRKTKQTIIDKGLASQTMMGMDYDANTTKVCEIFDKYNKVTYWYDFGDDWQFDIEIKKKIDYDKDYVTIKRFKGKYNPIEDIGGVYGLSDSDLEEYRQEFNMEYSQLALERKVYVKSDWHGMDF